ncbi:hypothetical protein [Lactiplantibacillus pentosus]|uniref:hypothetical protein n=1 Tax=Lactiplantibacillus pentosus TaxID=1589 RepID=UPI0021825638|nr:hypothetical protein [Lactiplantibacillus pentosus]
MKLVDEIAFTQDSRLGYFKRLEKMLTSLRRPLVRSHKAWANSLAIVRISLTVEGHHERVTKPATDPKKG